MIPRIGALPDASLGYITIFALIYLVSPYLNLDLNENADLILVLMFSSVFSIFLAVWDPLGGFIKKIIFSSLKEHYKKERKFQKILQTMPIVHLM